MSLISTLTPATSAPEPPLYKFPRKLDFLFEPAPIKVAYGGRGGSKSWNFGRALLTMGMKDRLRIGCFREVQHSLRESVHYLLTEQIEKMGLGWFYSVMADCIVGLNGTKFIYVGLSNITNDNIKSLEGLDIAWLEEAQALSGASIEKLMPTIRKHSSEVWASLNPDMETDPAYQYFVVNPPDDSVVVKINYYDNPWFHETTMDRIRRQMKAADPKRYRNVWLGHVNPALVGAVYFDEIALAQEQGRICNIPYDPLLKVHVVFDLGWNDAMSIGFVQRSATALYIIDYIEENRKTLDWYSAEMRKKPYNYGSVFLPHDGRHRDRKYGKTDEEIMQALGWDVQITPMATVKHGIDTLRMIFPRLYFDRNNTLRLVECCKRYRRHIAPNTQEEMQPVHDQYSHGADMMRYLAINADAFTNETWGGALDYPRLSVA